MLWSLHPDFCIPSWFLCVSSWHPQTCFWKKQFLIVEDFWRFAVMLTGAFFNFSRWNLAWLQLWDTQWFHLSVACGPQFFGPVWGGGWSCANFQQFSSRSSVHKDNILYGMNVKRAIAQCKETIMMQLKQTGPICDSFSLASVSDQSDRFGARII